MSSSKSSGERTLKAAEQADCRSGKEPEKGDKAHLPPIPPVSPENRAKVDDLCGLWGWVLSTRNKLQEGIQFCEDCVERASKTPRGLDLKLMLTDKTPEGLALIRKLRDKAPKDLPPEEKTLKLELLKQEDLGLKLNLARRSLDCFDRDLLPHCGRKDRPRSLKDKYSGDVAPEDFLGLPDKFSQRDKALADAVACLTDVITYAFKRVETVNKKRLTLLLGRAAPAIYLAQVFSGEKPKGGSVYRQHKETAERLSKNFLSDEVQAVIKNPKKKRGGQNKAAIILVSKATGLGTRTVQKACSNLRGWPHR